MARDPKRIPRVLSQLAALWMSAPDLRLGQLILNAGNLPQGFNYVGQEAAEMNGYRFSDIYNVEDEELIRRISQYIKKG